MPALQTTQQQIDAIQAKITKINQDKSDLIIIWGTQLTALQDTLGLNQRENAFFVKEEKKYVDAYYSAKYIIQKINQGFSNCPGTYDFSTRKPPADNIYRKYACHGIPYWTSLTKKYAPYLNSAIFNRKLWSKRVGDSNTEITQKTDQFNNKIDVFKLKKDEFEQDIKDIIQNAADAQKILDQEKLAQAAAEAMTDPEIIKTTKEAEIEKKRLEEESKRKRMNTIIWAAVAVIVGIGIVIAVVRGR